MNAVCSVFQSASMITDTHWHHLKWSDYRLSKHFNLFMGQEYIYHLSVSAHNWIMPETPAPSWLIASLNHHLYKPTIPWIIALHVLYEASVIQRQTDLQFDGYVSGPPLCFALMKCCYSSMPMAWSSSIPCATEWFCKCSGSKSLVLCVFCDRWWKNTAALLLDWLLKLDSWYKDNEKLWPLACDTP